MTGHGNPAASVFLALLVAALATGCGAAPGTAPQPSPSATQCPSGGKHLMLTGRHGARVEAVALGAGRPVAVVLFHEAGSGMCNAWPYAVRLAVHRHLQVVLFDRCAYGKTQCPDALGRGASRIAALAQPEVDYARAHGARRVSLVGASSGASDVVQAAAGVHGVSGVVALSPDMTDTDEENAHFERDREPTLMAYAPGDGYCLPGREHRWFRSIPATTKRLVVTPQQGRHGWDLVLADNGKPLPFARTVAAWVHGHFHHT